MNAPRYKVVCITPSGEQEDIRAFDMWHHADKFAAECNSEYGDIGRRYSVRDA